VRRPGDEAVRWWSGVLGGGVLRCGRGELVRACEVRDSPGVVGVVFIGAGDGRQGGGEGRLNGRSNSGDVNGNFKCL
jgi:hypothetical protein